MTNLLSCQGLSKAFGAKQLFSKISLGFTSGERAGLIGPNGSGKSTLLKVLADIESADEGLLFLQKQTRLVILSQEEKFDPDKDIEEVLSDAIKGGLDESIYTDVRKIISQGGFTEPNQKVSELSGGWLKRLSICRALLLKPDILLLDEPTNHLDIGSIIWLEEVLKNAPFVFVLVSHDRVFLENVCERIIELNQCYPDGFFSCKGNYSKFLTKREAFLENQRKQESVLSNKVRREVEWLRRGPKARSTKAKFRIDEAHRLQKQLSEVRFRNLSDKDVQLDFEATGRKTKKLIAIEKLSKKIAGRTLFEDLSFQLGPGSRLGLIGDNGTGKSTLMHIIHGNCEFESGNIIKADGLKIVLFEQQRQQLNQKETLRKSLSPTGDQVIYQGRSLHVVSWAKRFLFTPEQLEMPVGNLSGGEQARICIARLMLEPADLLLLDEPTNDLDISSLSVFEESLLEFTGAIVLVSHDRFFLDRITNHILGFDGKGNTELFGDYSQCLAHFATGDKKKGVKEKKVRPKEQSAPKLTYNEALEFESMEEMILAAEEELEIAEKGLDDPEIISDSQKLAFNYAETKKIRNRVDLLYERWEYLDNKQKKWLQSKK
jgi:ABC transport system ATP-binding/permease protein